MKETTATNDARTHHASHGTVSSSRSFDHHRHHRHHHHHRRRSLSTSPCVCLCAVLISRFSPARKTRKKHASERTTATKRVKSALIFSVLFFPLPSPRARVRRRREGGRGVTHTVSPHRSSCAEFPVFLRQEYNKHTHTQGLRGRQQRRKALWINIYFKFQANRESHRDTHVCVCACVYRNREEQEPRVFATKSFLSSSKSAAEEPARVREVAFCCQTFSLFFCRKNSAGSP